MSRTSSAPRWGLSVALAGLVALLLMALLAVGSASRADAAFTSGKCAGAAITGRGASFARDAHNTFINLFKPVHCVGTPALASVEYEALGSGEGRLTVKDRTKAPRFGMTDEPPSVEEIEQMNTGVGTKKPSEDVNPDDNGQIHVVPAAVGAVAPLVNFPNGCDPNALVGTEPAAVTSTDSKLIRVRFTKQKFEEVWEMDPSADTWREVFPGLTNNTACNEPIIRVVRKDDSGTTFTFKDYLHAIDSNEGWLTTYASGANKTLAWPGAEFGQPSHCGATTDAPGKQADAIDHLTSACSNNAENLTQKLIDTDGSIGYADISTARSKGLAVNPSGGDVDIYWTQVQNGSNVFQEPTLAANGYQTTGAKGANCDQTQFNNVPSTTFGNWAPVSGVNSPVGYGICTLTYGLVFDDNAEVWGNTPAEEAKARTVKDYWESVLSAPAQAALFPSDYAQLPASILAISKAGISSVDWNKAADAGAGGGGGNAGGGGGGGGATPSVVPPSNLFSLPKKSISSKTGEATISVKIPGPGKVILLGMAKSGKKQIKVGQVTLNASKAGTFNLKLKPSNAAKGLLREKGQLKVNLKVTYTPTGGTAKTTTSAVTLKLTKQQSGR